MNIQVIIGILLFSLLCLIISFFLSKHTKQINNDIQEENDKIQQRNLELNRIKDGIQRDLDDIQKELNRVTEAVKVKEKEVESRDNIIRNKTNEIANLYKKAEETAAVESQIQKKSLLYIYIFGKILFLEKIENSLIPKTI